MKINFLVHEVQFQYIKIMIHLNLAVNPSGKVANPGVDGIISPLKFPKNPPCKWRQMEIYKNLGSSKSRYMKEFNSNKCLYEKKGRS